MAPLASAARSRQCSIYMSRLGVGRQREPVMKIKEIPVIIASPGRNSVAVKIMVDAVLHCIGDVTVIGLHDSVLWRS